MQRSVAIGLLTLASLVTPSTLYDPDPSRSKHLIIKKGDNIDLLLEIAASKDFVVSRNISVENVQEHLRRYRQAWYMHEQTVLARIQELLGISFKANQIPVYVLNQAGLPLPDPLMIPFYSDKHAELTFVAALSHELVHNLILENFTPDEIHRLHAAALPDVPFYVAQHVVVFAVLECVYTTPPSVDIRIPQIERYRAGMSGNPEDSYVRAWRVMDQRGCRPILAAVREQVARMRQ